MAKKPSKRELKKLARLHDIYNKHTVLENGSTIWGIGYGVCIHCRAKFLVDNGTPYRGPANTQELWRETINRAYERYDSVVSKRNMKRLMTVLAGAKAGKWSEREKI